jgi:hypothetical protein
VPTLGSLRSPVPPKSGVFALRARRADGRDATAYTPATLMPMPKPQTLDAARIREALEQLAKRDKKLKVFGAASHGYRLNPPVAARQLSAFEKKIGVSLPDEYRTFITTVSNGGAGPAHGLFKLGEHDDGNRHCKWKRWLVGDVARPFPHRRSWNLPKAFWAREPRPAEELSEAQQDRLWEAWDAKLAKEYYDPRFMNGAIPICHLGCALRQWLVVTGPERGMVWCDDRADKKGVYPLRDARGRNVSFGSWYMSWLRDSMAKCRIRF